MANFLIMTIQVNLEPNPSEIGESNTNSPEMSLLKISPLAYHHSHFLAATLNFTSFFTIAFLVPHTFFTAGLFCIRYYLCWDITLIQYTEWCTIAKNMAAAHAYTLFMWCRPSPSPCCQLVRKLWSCMYIMLIIVKIAVVVFPIKLMVGHLNVYSIYRHD